MNRASCAWQENTAVCPSATSRGIGGIRYVAVDPAAAAEGKNKQTNRVVHTDAAHSPWHLTTASATMSKDIPIGLESMALATTAVGEPRGPTLADFAYEISRFHCDFYALIKRGW